MTKLTTRYDPASAAAVSEHSQTELREEPRFGYLKHKNIRTWSQVFPEFLLALISEISIKTNTIEVAIASP